MKEVAVVILNYNGLKWLQQFLPTLVKYTSKLLADIIVADNASTDHSIEYLKTFKDVNIIQLEKNWGYAGGYNKALEQLNHPFFMLINSDVEVSKNWLEPIYSYISENKKIAACQPKILLQTNKSYFEYAGASGGFIDCLGYPFCRGRIFDSIEKDVNQYNNTRLVFWASGACLMIRSKLFKDCGGFDSRFFAHMEEIDLCWRMQNEGYHISVVPASTVYHVGGGTLSSDSPRKIYLNFRNNLLMIFKNESTLARFFIILIRLFLDALAGFNFLINGKFSYCWAIIKAHWVFYFMSFSYFFRPNFRKNKNLNGRLQGSILIQYFIKNKKEFNELPKIK